jgi:ethanolamine utilization protein EutA (predicted chaperonin)
MLDMPTGDTICNIVLGEWTTLIEICRDGMVVDSAVVGLGGSSLQINNDNVVLAISENGETFLDAVAKKIKAGDQIESQMTELLANLMAETVVNAVARKRPPQISMRLLDSEPLSQFYGASGFILSQTGPETRMSSLFFQSLKESLQDRSLRWVHKIR